MKHSSTLEWSTQLSWIAVSALCVAILGCGSSANDSLSPNLGTSSVTAAETLVPYEDVSNPGGFDGFGGSLWEGLNDSTCNDDVDYISRNRLGLPPTSSEATVRFTTPVGNPTTGQVKVRFKVTGNYSTDTPNPTFLKYDLFQGPTLKATHLRVPTGSSYISDSIGVGAITNWNGLTIRFTMSLKPAGPNEQIQGRITCARLEVH